MTCIARVQDRMAVQITAPASAPLPDLGADFLAAGIGPDPLPGVTILAIKREPGVIARAVGNGDEIVH